MRSFAALRALTVTYTHSSNFLKIYVYEKHTHYSGILNGVGKNTHKYAYISKVFNNTSETKKVYKKL